MGGWRLGLVAWTCSLATPPPLQLPKSDPSQQFDTSTMGAAADPADPTFLTPNSAPLKKHINMKGMAGSPTGPFFAIPIMLPFSTRIAPTTQGEHLAIPLKPEKQEQLVVQMAPHTLQIPSSDHLRYLAITPWGQLRIHLADFCWHEHLLSQILPLSKI